MAISHAPVQDIQKRLLDNIRAAQAVVQTADETFSRNNEIFSGIFEMLGHKLDMIECNAKELIRASGSASAA